jgi:hypothetical protein
VERDGFHFFVCASPSTTGGADFFQNRHPSTTSACIDVEGWPVSFSSLVAFPLRFDGRIPGAWVVHPRFLNLKTPNSIMSPRLPKPRGPARAVFLIASTLVLERGLAGPETIYFFSQQRVSNLTLTGSIPGNLTGGAVYVETLTEAQQSHGLTGFSFVSTSGTYDAAQSLVPVPWPASNPVPPSENYTVVNPLVPAADGVVLGQYGPTPWGPLGSTTGLISVSDIGLTDFARADVLGSGPAIQGQPTLMPGLFGASGQVGLSFDTVAEASASRSTGFNYGYSVWTVSGDFTLASPDTVTLSFDHLMRLVGFSDIECEDALGEVLVQLEIAGTTVDGVAMSVTTASPVNETVNLFSLATTLSSDGPLAAGNYSFSIIGYSYAELCTAPETSAGRPLQMGLLILAGWNGIRRFHQRRSVVETSMTA